MATHSSTLAWKLPWPEEPGVGCCLCGRTASDMTEATQQQQASDQKQIGAGVGNGDWLRMGTSDLFWVMETF